MAKMTRGSVSTDSCEKAVYPEYRMCLVRTACGVLKNERPVGLPKSWHCDPALSCLFLKGHDCLVFQAAFHSKSHLKIQYPHLGLVMNGIMCFYMVVDAHCVLLGRVQLHTESNISSTRAVHKETELYSFLMYCFTYKLIKLVSFKVLLSILDTPLPTFFSSSGTRPGTCFAGWREGPLSNFFSISSTVWNRRLFSEDFNFVKKKKSAGAKSGE